jgi:predicted RNA-binding Zn ribbon-like protein
LMETSGYIEELRIVGGHVALDFVNTVDGDPEGESRLESLRGYGDLVAWSGRVGLLDPEEAERLVRDAKRRTEEAEAVYRWALELREVLYGVLRNLAEGKTPPSQSLRSLGGYERDAISRGVLRADDSGFQWEWKEEQDLARPMWPVVHAATELLTSGDLGRLKMCAGCHWLFLDASRNHSRRWCTMEVCGTDEKMRRYVAKRAARRKYGQRAKAG